MIEAAADELNLDLQRSVIIGDRLTDLEAGARAGLSTFALVSTGYGLKERAKVKLWEKTQLNSSVNGSCKRVWYLESMAELASSLVNL